MGKFASSIILIYPKEKRRLYIQKQIKIVRQPHLPLLFYGYVDTLCLDISTSIIGDICQFHSTLYIQ